MRIPNRLPEIVSDTYFTVLGVGPALGRVLESAEDRAPGANPVRAFSRLLESPAEAGTFGARMFRIIRLHDGRISGPAHS